MYRIDHQNKLYIQNRWLYRENFKRLMKNQQDATVGYDKQLVVQEVCWWGCSCSVAKTDETRRPDFKYWKNLFVFYFSVMRWISWIHLFPISTSLRAIDRTLSGATTPGQSVPKSDGNEEVHCIPQSFDITGASPSDCLVSYPRH